MSETVRVRIRHDDRALAEARRSGADAVESLLSRQGRTAGADVDAKSSKATIHYAAVAAAERGVGPVDLVLPRRCDGASALRREPADVKDNEAVAAKVEQPATKDGKKV